VVRKQHRGLGCRGNAFEGSGFSVLYIAKVVDNQQYIEHVSTCMEECGFDDVEFNYHIGDNLQNDWC
jgi:hypothetical protein